MNEIFYWVSNHYEEILGTLFSLVYLYFSIKQNIWLWPLGLISSAIYVYVFFKAGIYADMALQVYYVVISIYGWYYWSRKKTKNTNPEVKVKYTGKRNAVFLLIITAALFIVIAFVLKNYTDSQIPFWDAFTTAASITATWMLAKKYIEHWIVWVLVDLVSSGLYVYKNLYFTVFLYLVYTVMAVVGYFQWKNTINKVSVNEK